MKLFIAGTSSAREIVTRNRPLYVLESFYSVKDWQIAEIPKYKMFLLDSGAFSFMNSVKDTGKINFDAYLDKYIDFINKNDIKYFFELDIDSVVGYEKVLEMRKKLEQRTGKKCIPVWHASRGKEEFLKMCDEYDYVAFGGMLTDGVSTKKIIEHLPWFTNEARKRGTKVHGLGFTRKDAEKYGFFSVDSTSWLAGGKYGTINVFTGSCMKSVKKPKGKKTTHYQTVNEFNLREWIKFQKYLDTK